MKTLEWKDVESAVDYLVSQIGDTKLDSIVAIGRGGCIPAAMLAHRLGVKTVDYVNYSRKQGFLGDTIARLDDSNSVLFIDDATETGGTFTWLKSNYGSAEGAEFFTAVLFSKDTCPEHINFVGSVYEGDCPVMPWEIKSE